MQDEKWCTCVLSKDRLAVEGQRADSRGPIRLNRRLQLTPYKEIRGHPRCTYRWSGPRSEPYEMGLHTQLSQGVDILINTGRDT
ncbi:hypothetical protein R3I94_008496 [Phoxinus phoxinus]